MPGMPHSLKLKPQNRGPLVVFDLWVSVVGACVDLSKRVGKGPSCCRCRMRCPCRRVSENRRSAAHTEAISREPAVLKPAILSRTQPASPSAHSRVPAAAYTRANEACPTIHHRTTAATQHGTTAAGYNTEGSDDAGVAACRATEVGTDR